MTAPIISVENLSKRYTLRHQQGGYRTLRDTLAKKARSLLGRNGLAAPAAQEEFWALKDVSFEINRGDVVGIIGRNGAGKSTLLKILSRITEPTSGTIRLGGRVASLLEVGTGFHPELTGRENIFLNGAILGMTKAEIRRKFDEIVAFAEVERFLDTPVKHYSSGMYVRLAFAVAAHLEPEILIVDEVLAVGDIEFQKKCLGKMRDVSSSGRTVLFVSHSMSAILALCSSAVMLRNGNVVQFGETAQAVESFLGKGIDSCSTSWTSDEEQDADSLLATWAKPINREGSFDTGSPIQIGVRYRLSQPQEGLILGFRICSQTETELVYSLYDDSSPQPPAPHPAGTFESVFTIPANFLSEGTFSLKFAMGIHNRKTISLNDKGTLTIRMHNLTGIGRAYQVPQTPSFTSIVRPLLQVTTHEVT
jgi:lipopolysaccharide transport system ATP-binding protein